MGAEHKLDLTSDVTHLLVGDADTLKYKYVAREREDVKVLRPEWVDAVRSCWMDAKAIDPDALATEYRLPTFFGLKICITGFDDLTFRARLQNNVMENGGEYTGDLTKDVTHLIAARPDGKKYEYGSQWQKKVISLKWYKDSLARGMQLDESLYHPSKAIDDQGIGAWNRIIPQPQSQLGKRSREDPAGLEPPRKLRRTASARFGSQSDNLWTDIVGGGGFEVSEHERPPLRPSKSLPAIVPHVKDVSAQINMSDIDRPDPVAIGNGYLDGKYFVIYGFERKKEDMLRGILLENGGTVLDTLEHLNQAAYTEEAVKIIIVPYQTPWERVEPRNIIAESSLVVSEFWLEWCMLNKAYAPPRQYPLCSIMSQTKPPGFSKLTINVSGFPGIQTLQMSKVLRLMGATYTETFTQSTSVLICKDGGDSPEKLSHARMWRVPAVSESWLWSCMRNGRMPSFDKYLIQINNDSVWSLSKAQQQPKDPANTRLRAKHSSPERRKPGSDFLVHEDSERVVGSGNGGSTATIVQVTRSEHFEPIDAPLRAISPNSPRRKSREPEQRSKKRLFRTLDGPSDEPSDQDVSKKILSKRSDHNGDSIATEVKNQDIAGEIRDFYNMKANAKSTSNAAITESPKKARLQGRALSNLSNASATSKSLRSRASSIDSINTDGVGSEIAPLAGNGRSQDAIDSHSFTGRAKSRLVEEAAPSIELGDPGLYQDYVAVEEVPPQMTQLVYDDSEDTIALREKLAAKRRQRSRLGQKEDDPRPAELKEPRRIRDNDIIANAGWGAGRRTRHKDKSTPGLKEF